MKVSSRGTAALAMAQSLPSGKGRVRAASPEPHMTCPGLCARRAIVEQATVVGAQSVSGESGSNDDATETSSAPTSDLVVKSSQKEPGRRSASGSGSLAQAASAKASES